MRSMPTLQCRPAGCFLDAIRTDRRDGRNAGLPAKNYYAGSLPSAIDSASECSTFGSSMWLPSNSTM
jgi:hypothetical protein